MNHWIQVTGDPKIECVTILIFGHKIRWTWLISWTAWQSWRLNLHFPYSSLDILLASWGPKVGHHQPYHCQMEGSELKFRWSWYHPWSCRFLPGLEGLNMATSLIWCWHQWLWSYDSDIHVVKPLFPSREKDITRKRVFDPDVLRSPSGEILSDGVPWAEYTKAKRGELVVFLDSLLFLRFFMDFLLSILLV